MNNKNLKPHQFNHKVYFGSFKTFINENSGNLNDGFVSDFSLWCSPYMRSINQRFSLEGTKLADTITIIVRHNKRINNKLIVQYKGDLYKIVDLSIDDSNSYLKYDYLTLKVDHE